MRTFNCALVLIALLSGSYFIQAQSVTVQPEFWWAGMQNKNLQLLVHGDNVAQCKVELGKAGKLARLTGCERVSNANYLFINIETSSVTGRFNIILTDSLTNKSTTVAYELRERSQRQRGLNSSDLVYMLMPDRFANGNHTNDNIVGMLEQADNSNPDGRHGGDIQGIADHISYFRQLGVTGLWITPLLENNMPKYSYHGYAITNFYRTDPRYGTNADYQQLANLLHHNGLKLTMDMVFNHCGSNNFLATDKPDSTWIHLWPEFTRSNYRGTAVIDPHASQYDRRLMQEGWFDTTMPDLNQSNPLLLNYLVQCTIWWTELLGLDAIRMDTYPYNNQAAMSEWCRRLHTEYPDLSLLGECWLNENPLTFYFVSGVGNTDGFSSGLDHVTDFPLCFALQKAFNEEEGWDTGLARIYQSLTSDFLLPAPDKNVIFADNHDLTRIATTLGSDINKMKMLMTIILTTRGIPVLYYGTELMMESAADGDGQKRENFPGGFAADLKLTPKNAFTSTSLTDAEREMQNFISTLANFRKQSASFSGRLIHFVPQDGVYVYFRIADADRVMVIINNSDHDVQLSTAPYAECLNGYTSGIDVISGTTLSNLKTITVPSKSPLIINLK